MFSESHPHVWQLQTVSDRLYTRREPAVLACQVPSAEPEIYPNQGLNPQDIPGSRRMMGASRASSQLMWPSTFLMRLAHAATVHLKFSIVSSRHLSVVFAPWRGVGAWPRPCRVCPGPNRASIQRWRTNRCLVPKSRETERHWMQCDMIWTAGIGGGNGRVRPPSALSASVFGEVCVRSGQRREY